MKKKQFTYQFGVAIFEGKKKVKEIIFASERDMVYWLYKNDPLSYPNPEVMEVTGK